MSIPSTAISHDEPLVCSPKRARHLLCVGQTRLYELLGAQELESFRDGKSRKIVVASIHRYIARKLAEEVAA